MKKHSSSFMMGVFLCLIGFFGAHSFQAQVVDPNFYPVIATGSGLPIYSSTVQSDGKIFYAAARVMPNGASDPNYIGSGINAPVRDLKVLPDGKILIAGDFSFVSGQSRSGLARLNANGSLDTTFFIFFQSTTVRKIAVQPDGKILVAGNSIFFKHLIRLNPDGSPDDTFQNNLPSGANELTGLILQPDGKFIVAYRIFESAWKTKIARFNANGTIDSSFTVVEALGTGASSNGTTDVDAMLLLPDGKLIIGGSLFSVAGVSKNFIAGINANGSIDNSFAANADGAVFSLALQTNGKILAGGIFSTINGITRQRLARLNPDGNLDESLNSDFSESFASVNTISVQQDGKIITGGQFLKIGSFTRYRIARLNSDGSVDTGFFFIFTGSQGVINEITPRADGKIYLGGQYVSVNADTRRLISRINIDGSTDASLPEISFGSNGFVLSILSKANNKLLIGGDFALPLRAANEDGTADATFNHPFTTLNSSSVRSLVEQPDKKILVGGTFSLSEQFRNNLARLNADGSLDTSFLNNLAGPNALVGKIALQADGKIVITGSFTQVNGAPRSRIARLNSDGSLDTSFQNGLSGLNSSNNSLFVNQLAIQPDGKILIGGPFETVNGIERRYLARLNSDGTLDTTFLKNLSGPESAIPALALRANGQIIIGGSFATVNGQARRALAQLNPDGTLDNNFDFMFSGFSQTITSLAVERNGSILVGLANSGGTVNGLSRVGLFRILYRKPEFDFDGDGKSDVSVFRPQSGVWHLLQSQSNYVGIGFGLSTDKLVPADYDGDGKTDVAVFRENPSEPGKAKFYILQSSNNQLREEQFGATGDIPVSGDWDGDGKSDIGVYRAGTQANPQGYFYHRPSSQSTVNFVPYPWGSPGDKPVVADYDGDGKIDPAVYRPITGQWFIQRSRDGFYAIQFGASEDKPVIGDYDGDGKTDQAVFRPSNGVWYIWRSRDGFAAAQFGVSTDKPVPADYDGDGKTDFAVYRDGNWFILNSKNGFSALGFGNSTDKPIADSFVP